MLALWIAFNDILNEQTTQVLAGSLALGLDDSANQKLSEQGNHQLLV